MVQTLPFQPSDQVAVKALILDGLVDHWGTLDESKNPDLNNIAVTYVDATFLVAWLDDEIVGTGAFIPHSKKQVEIARMSVRKDLRRQGIGQKILSELCKQAVQSGYEEVILETTDTWQDVIAFYQQYGFEITHYLDGDVYFRMDLNH
ncbi:MAG: GNAT family N-acetyltransferase [Anaerolineae bacterium]|jgi:ribosomal protein S18 acetylase RimI-like enzyme|nr:GNAT family N-acetyltransferase [Anaerolineae bacterium]MBT7190911.1 GNAT family N-acetyltransferase [Anaerolineae bacterium]MBT7324490.1 GNAT family N-acetyltransferase [Anaerolineae bacterium]